MSSKKEQLEERKRELNKKIYLAEGYKKEIINKVQKTLINYQNRKISLDEYKKILNNLPGNKSAEEWINYYDKYIDSCKKLVEDYDRNIKKNLISVFVITIFILLISLFIFTILLSSRYSKQKLFLAPTEKETIELKMQSCLKQSEELDKNLFSNSCEEIYASNKETIFNSLSTYAGISIESHDNSIINCDKIDQVLLYYEFYTLNNSKDHQCVVGVDANAGESWTEKNIDCNEISSSRLEFIDFTADENWICDNFFNENGAKAFAKAQALKINGEGQDIFNFNALYFRVSYSDIIPPKLTIKKPQFNAIYNLELVDFELALNEKGDCNYSLDEGISNYTMQSQDNVNFISNLNITDGDYSVRYYCWDSSNNLNDSEIISFSKNTSLEINNFSIIEDNSEERIAIGKPVKWKKKIIKEEGEINIKIPAMATDIKIKKDQIEKEIISENKTDIKLEEDSGIYEIEYVLPAPTLKEEELNEKKIVAISVPEGIEYKNILASISIEEITKDKRFIKIYSNKEKKYLEFKALDTDNNEYLDSVEWNAPSSDDIFEIIIQITNAEHLDENKDLISNIYEQVKELDEIWSEPIYHNEFIRVSFEEKLDSTKDITLYARNPEKERIIIEIYYYNTTQKIAEFPIIKKEGYYTIYLTELQGEHDTFDLKIKSLNEKKDSYLEFDHIIDPFIIADIQPSLDVALTTLDNSTFVFAWVDDTEDDISFIIYGTNGTPLTNTIDADTEVNGNSRVAVKAIDSSTFILSWYDGIDQDITYAVYNKDESINIPATDIETAVGTPSVDIEIIDMLDRFQACYIDDIEDDADVITVNYGTWGAGLETNIDTSVGATLGLQNLISCTSITNTRFALIYFDDASNDATFSIRDQNSVNIVLADIDTNIGETGQVAITSLNNNYFAMGWYDSASQNIQIAIRDVNNNIILAPTLVDANSGTQSRIAMATIKSSSDPIDWFAVAWNDRNADNIQAAIYDSSGILRQGPFILASDENTTSLLFDIYGKDTLIPNPNPIAQTSICDNKFLFAYTTNTGAVATKTFNLDGTEWTGVCDNISPTIDDISNIPDQIVTESGITDVTFTVQVTDANGAFDINDATITTQFTKDSVTRTGACSFVSDINITTTQYSCTIGIQYFDAPGTWTVSAEIQDQSNGFSAPYSETFILLETACITISPAFWEWPTLFPGDAEKLASNNPIIISNTCNKEGILQVKAFDILGETDSSYKIPANSFTVHTVNLCSLSDPGTIMAHAATTLIAGATLLRGDNSIGEGQEQLFICLENVPDNLKAQRYSTLIGSIWEISLAFATLKIKRKKRKKVLTKENLLEVLNEKLKDKYDTTLDELLLIKKTKEIKIPIELFNQKIGAAESLAKYLKENLGLKFSEIEKLINRNQRTIWINYRNAVRKMKEKINIRKTSISIPIDIFSNRKLSILESLIYNLREKELKNTEISKILNKDPRNIYTLYSRAIKKLKSMPK